MRFALSSDSKTNCANEKSICFALETDGLLVSAPNIGIRIRTRLPARVKSIGGVRKLDIQTVMHIESFVFSILSKNTYIKFSKGLGRGVDIQPPEGCCSMFKTSPITCLRFWERFYLIISLRQVLPDNMIYSACR